MDISGVCTYLRSEIWGSHTCGSGVAVQVLLLQLFGVNRTFLGSNGHFWGLHLSEVRDLGFPHLRLRCRSSGVAAAAFWGPWEIFGVHTWQILGVLSPGPSSTGLRCFKCCCCSFLGSNAHFWGPHLSGVTGTESPHLRLRCHSSGVAAAAFWGPWEIFGVHTWLILGGPLTWAFIHGAQVLQVLLLQLFGFKRTFLGSNERFWGLHLSGVRDLGFPHLRLRCRSSGVAAAAFWGPREIFGAHTWQILGGPLTWAFIHGAQVLQVLLLQLFGVNRTFLGSNGHFWGLHLSEVRDLGFPHLRLRCRSSGVAAAAFWGPQEIFGAHTWLILGGGPLTWAFIHGTQVLQVLLLQLFGVNRTFLGSNGHFWGLYLSGVRDLGFPHLGLRCCSSGVVAAAFWGPMHIFGVQCTFLGSSPVQGHRY
ncbi:uncharacterized protein ACIQIH_002158 [Cyanocitta cristata]